MAVGVDDVGRDHGPLLGVRTLPNLADQGADPAGVNADDARPELSPDLVPINESPGTLGSDIDE